MMEETKNAVRLPEFGSYGRYAGGNYGLHCLWFEVGGLTVYFSYQTIVAFRTAETGLIVSENIWSRTTGKHLNWIDRGQGDRLPRDQFENRLSEVLEKYSVN